MKNFTLLIPKSKAKAWELLPGSFEDAGRARVLAGGQDLLGEMKDYLIAPDALVDIKRLDGLRGIEAGDGGVEIGALVTIAEIEEHEGLARGHPLLVQAARSIASPQIRSQATLGGNLCQRPRCWYYRNEDTVCLKRGGDECFSYGGLNKYNAILGGGPSYIVHPSDMAPALVALDATVRLESPRGERAMPLSDFFTLPTRGDVTRENVLGPDELVTAVSVGKEKRGWRSAYLKFKERGSFDWALSAVAAALRFDGDRVAEARLVLGGVAPVPWRCSRSEEALVGAPLDGGRIERAAELAVDGAQPLEHNGYKIPLTQALVRRALEGLRS